MSPVAGYIRDGATGKRHPKVFQVQPGLGIFYRVLLEQDRAWAEIEKFIKSEHLASLTRSETLDLFHDLKAVHASAKNEFKRQLNFECLPDKRARLRQAKMFYDLHSAIVAKALQHSNHKAELLIMLFMAECYLTLNHCKTDLDRERPENELTLVQIMLHNELLSGQAVPQLRWGFLT